MGSAQGGVWRSTDRGANWTQMGASSLSAAVRALAVDPLNSQTIYAGIYSGFVYKSTDGGSNWAPLTNGHTTDQDAFTILVDPYNSQTVYVGD